MAAVRSFSQFADEAATRRPSCARQDGDVRASIQFAIAFAKLEGDFRGFGGLFVFLLVLFLYADHSDLGEAFAE
jgi:hypothetical protein